MKDVKNFEGKYAVTSCGRVWSYKHNIWLTAFDIGNGYLRVDLYDNEQHNFRSVHRLVAEAYIPNPNNYETVDHIDNNRQHNTVNNLQWLSRIDNLVKEQPDKKPIRIRCKETGEEFESLADCRRKIGCSTSNLSQHLKGLRGCVNGLHFERIEE